jgi:hypothetical protein
MEKAVKQNQAGYAIRLLAMIKANAGQIQEARTLFADSADKLPPSMKNVRFFMSAWPFKDFKVARNFAEGYVKAGLPGESNDVYKISSDNRLTKKDIRGLFFGKKVKGFNLVTKKPWLIEREKDGKATILDGDKSDSGRSWIEDDMLCDQWNNLYEGLKDCWVIYRNPEGSPENFDSYLGVPGYGIFPFSEVE